MAVAIITAAVATLVRQQAQESRPPNSAQRYPPTTVSNKGNAHEQAHSVPPSWYLLLECARSQFG